MGQRRRGFDVEVVSSAGGGTSEVGVKVCKRVGVFRNSRLWGPGETKMKKITLSNDENAPPPKKERTTTKKTMSPSSFLAPLLHFFLRIFNAFTAPFRFFWGLIIWVLVDGLGGRFKVCTVCMELILSFFFFSDCFFFFFFFFVGVSSPTHPFFLEFGGGSVALSVLHI